MADTGRSALWEHAVVSHVWLIETLTELRIYAAQNGLTALAEHLEQSIQLAHVELTVREEDQDILQKPETGEGEQET